MNKNQLRKQFAARRKSLSPADVATLSHSMNEHFRKMVWSKLSRVLSYRPIAHHQEFDPAECETSLRELIPDVVIAHPRLTDDEGIMKAIEVSAETTYQLNRLSILEPAGGRLLTPESFDLVITPLVVFDRNAFRVGYGKGFYDRWLAQCRPEVIKLGFSFFEPVDAIGDINEFDVPLNYCITPTRVYEF